MDRNDDDDNGDDEVIGDDNDVGDEVNDDNDDEDDGDTQAFATSTLVDGGLRTTASRLQRALLGLEDDSRRRRRLPVRRGLQVGRRRKENLRRNLGRKARPVRLLVGTANAADLRPGGLRSCGAVGTGWKRDGGGK